ncbi:DUF4870 domain-containing protein [Salisediminibacterium halotolerans]|uniref:DUF4870 domain-containing protein n=1 Tax=Salisediminibacterium halotolerans TaxID=517425 RepID=UPI000EB25A35|nr:DUF4870 domain-containing protein [Salisediminibacterium halotolerans]RLJ71734.1 putative Tic20 family protein [Actinophytocola xinjiangensis]RPE86884.1 putative Tic20 family protein [Salisediminibacterium halotolerans]TWG32947.1 putative Tic20 family protein [Salisediminibacterium halotolerans]GEL08212.1 hypothetical protein SHA02_16280 [Salisediminibacterium halotolerans]
MLPDWKDRGIVAGGCVIAILIPVPVINILIVYALYQRLRTDRPFVDHQLRQNVNFQISMQVYLAGAFILLFALPFLPGLFFPGSLDWLRIPLGLGMIGTSVLLLFIWFTIFTAALIFAVSGRWFQYPFSLQWLK